MNKEHILPQLLLRSWPFPRGAGRIADRLFDDLKFTEKTAIVKTTDGFAMTVVPNDLIGRHIYLIGEFDRTVPEVLIKLSRPGDILLDIGANIGYVAGCFLAKVPRSRAICVDPEPYATELLRLNMAQFGDRAEIHEVALSSEDGESFLLRGGATTKTPSAGVGAIKIKLTSAATFLAKLNRLDLVKIDVEGHEIEIFRDATKELCRLRPRAIVFEDFTGESYPDGAIGRILRQCGYKVRAIDKRLISINLRSVETKEACTSNDYLATTED